MYILKSDLLNFIAEKTLDQLTGGKSAIGTTPATSGDDTKWQSLINPTVEQVKAYLRHWYDADKEMRSIETFVETDAHLINDRLVVLAVDENDDDTLYLCIQDAPAGTLITDTDYFEQIDDRNSFVLEITCILIIYKLHRKVNPREVPVQRMEDFTQATKDLKDIQRGNITLEIAERVDVEKDDPGHEIAYGEFEEDETLEDY